MDYVCRPVCVGGGVGRFSQGQVAEYPIEHKLHYYMNLFWLVQWSMRAIGPRSPYLPPPFFPKLAHSFKHEYECIHATKTECPEQ